MVVASMDTLMADLIHVDEEMDWTCPAHVTNVDVPMQLLDGSAKKCSCNKSCCYSCNPGRKSPSVHCCSSITKSVATRQHDPFAKVDPFINPLSISSFITYCAGAEELCATNQLAETVEPGEVLVAESAVLVQEPEQEFELNPAFVDALAPPAPTPFKSEYDTQRPRRQRRAREFERTRQSEQQRRPYTRFSQQLLPVQRQAHELSREPPTGPARRVLRPASRILRAESGFASHSEQERVLLGQRRILHARRQLVAYDDLAITQKKCATNAVDHLPLDPYKYVGCDSYIGPGPTNEVNELLCGLQVESGALPLSVLDHGIGSSGSGIELDCEMDVDQRRDRGPRQYHQRNHGGRGGYDNRRRQFSGNYRRDGGGDRFQGGGGQNRKRRYDDGDDQERRPMKQRYEEPVASRLRREILVVGEAVGPDYMAELASQIGKRIADNFEDDQVSGLFLDQVIQLISEQPLKIPIIAAIFLYANESNAAVAKEILERAAERAQDALEEGRWREFKLMLKFFACLQEVYEGDGIFPLFDDLFNKAADQQTASEDDVIGLEIVKTILLTLPYAMATNSSGLEEKARALLEKTEIVATTQHPSENVAEPYPIDNEDRPFSFQSALRLLQEQSQSEASNGWSLSCIPRIYSPSKAAKEENGDEAMNGTANSVSKHAFPNLIIPAQAHPGPRPLFPETFFSIYADQQVESTPGTTSIAASLIRDAVVDTINILDINRHSVAKFLIELDNYFAPGTFVKRATSFDKLKDIPEGQSTWKTEDMAIDSVFAQIFLLPQAEHKLVYYHSVITETCKLAPGAIAPTLGRAIRFLFKHIDAMDLELATRFLDWFSHHLSNFDFRWKWTEWTDYVDASPVSPKHAFILAAIDKEIRLSFTKRIRDTLPPEYHKLIAEGKLKDTPDFKYKTEGAPYAAEGQQILSLLRKKAPETEVEPLIEAIQQQALAQGVQDPLVPSVDAYMTAVCHIGSKSLSHVLSCIDRCKERLLSIGAASEAARRQIIQSVVDYWKDLPGVAVNIIDKLLNFTIVTPESVVRWCLGSQSLNGGEGLADSWRYEMLAATMGKITNRMRQIVAARVHAHKVDMAQEQIAILDETITKEREGMRALFGLITQLLEPYTSGTAVADGMHDANDAQAIQAWAQRWVLAFKRKLAVEETVVGESAIDATLVLAKLEAAREEVKRVKEAEEREKRRLENEERRKKEEEEQREAEEAARKEKERQEDEERQRRAQENGASTGVADGGADSLDVADDDV